MTKVIIIERTDSKAGFDKTRLNRFSPSFFTINRQPNPLTFIFANLLNTVFVFKPVSLMFTGYHDRKT